MRQISPREAERRGGVTEPLALRSGGVDQQTDRGECRRSIAGLDPAWAGNPGVDREQVTDGFAVRQRSTSADQDLARKAVRQVVDSPLLERHLGPRTGTYPKGDLPVAYLEREYAEALGSKTRLVRMTEYAADKQSDAPSGHHGRGLSRPAAGAKRCPGRRATDKAPGAAGE